jgi:hypothetical protein
MQQIRAVRSGAIKAHPYMNLSFLEAFQTFASDIDLLGLFALTVGFLLVLVPLTIANNAPDGYKSAYIIAMIVLGSILLCSFPFIELWVSKPIINIRRIISNKDVLIISIIVFVHQFAISMAYTRKQSLKFHNICIKACRQDLSSKLSREYFGSEICLGLN